MKTISLEPWMQPAPIVKNDMIETFIYSRDGETELPIKIEFSFIESDWNDIVNWVKVTFLNAGDKDKTPYVEEDVTSIIEDQLFKPEFETKIEIA